MMPKRITAAWLLACWLLLTAHESAAQWPIKHPALEDSAPVTVFHELENRKILLGKYDRLLVFDGLEAKPVKLLEGHEKIRIQSIHQHHQSIWIGTRQHGLFQLNQHLQVLAHFNQESAFEQRISNHINHIVNTDDGLLWLATDLGLYRLDPDGRSLHIPIQIDGQLAAQQNTSRLQLIDASSLLVGTMQGAYVYDLNKAVFTVIDHPELSTEMVFDVTATTEHIWIGTQSGLYRFEAETRAIDKIRPETINSRAAPLHAVGEDLYFGQLGVGLFVLNTETIDQPIQIQSNRFQDVVPWRFLHDAEHHLWVSTFNQGVFLLDLNHTALATARWQHNIHDCFDNQAYSDLINVSNKRFLAVTNDAIMDMDLSTGRCSKYHQNRSGEDVFTHQSARRIHRKSDVEFWVSTTQGLHVLNLMDGRIDRFENTLPNVSANFIHALDPQTVLLGTYLGLFVMDSNSGEAQEIENPHIAESWMYFKSLKWQDQLFLTSSAGLLQYDHSSRTLLTIDSVNEQLAPGETLNDVSINSNNQLQLLGETGHIYVVNPELQLVQDIALPTTTLFHVSISADSAGNTWVGTNQGLLQIDSQGRYHFHNQRNNLVNQYYLLAASLKLSNDLLVLGGKQGLDLIQTSGPYLAPQATQLAFTDLYRFNQLVIPNADADFDLPDELSRLQQLSLSHRDYVMGFEFGLPPGLDSSRYDFEYQLSGFEPNWNQANSNRITYTNLPAGSYELKIRARDALNIQPDAVQSMQIVVSPPPWLSWWAIMAYMVTLMVSVYAYVQWKYRSNIRQAKLLRTEVANKTRELNQEKQTVERLLSKKNELFANVSHEFRTPLTLILGPIKELVNRPFEQQDQNHLKVINRNARRLLSLVEQLLQIARVSNLEKVKTQPQNTQQQVAGLVDSFQHMAQGKRINLSLEHNMPATIDVTDQFIDAVLGNLVSNAIKYTPVGGSVQVHAETQSNTWVLRVKDTGAGLTEQQQTEIFQRFKRLESHQQIEGIGIGLSVVEEVVKVNQGHIQVNSELGVGSEFTVTVPLSDASSAEEKDQISSLVKQLQSESPLQQETAQATTSSTASSHKNTVLVIEDNHDMRNLITDIVGQEYHCIQASDGVKGVAAAIEHVPDIIISDVMMPEMDGFKVARIIRADQRTSHIPLMLLTALHDKTSRIKGWRENVDAYMTKPFDRDELLVQLDNMLTIRDILKSKAGRSIKKGKHLSLPKTDQQFIEKLMSKIAENYHEPLLNRSRLAAMMAVSDRQLQRKTKALIDQNPNDLLREFRLKKASELLNDGYQVSRVADECGFNSVSYFSQCFKAQYGVSPKQYQSSAKNS